MVKKIVNSLEGEIHVDSEVNQGTQVTVHFPLNPSATYADPNHNSSSSLPRPPNPVSMLRTECPDKTVTFFGFETVATILLKDSVQFYLTEWYHFSIIRDIHRADFVIVDESTVDELLSKFGGNSLPYRIVALRSTTIRDKSLPAAIHSILKPVGPYGLAKVLLNCWTRTLPRTPKDELPHPIATAPKQLVLETEPEPKPVTETLIQGTPKPSTAIAVSRSKSLNDHEPEVGESKFEIIAVPEPAPEPAPAPTTPTPKPNLVPSPESLPTIQALPTVAPKEARPSREKASTVSVQKVETVQPRILCVDDNPINLKVLQAYLKKLEKKNVKFAENGLEAFKAVESSDAPFDLIFMGKKSPTPCTVRFADSTWKIYRCLFVMALRARRSFVSLRSNAARPGRRQEHPSLSH